MGERFEMVKEQATEAFFALSREPFRNADGVWIMNNTYAGAKQVISEMTPHIKPSC